MIGIKPIPRQVKVKGKPIKGFGYRRYRSRTIKRIVHNEGFDYGRARQSGYIIYSGKKVRVFLHDAMWKCEEMMDQDERDIQIRQSTTKFLRWINGQPRNSA